MYRYLPRISTNRLLKYVVLMGLTALCAFGELLEPVDFGYRTLRDKVLQKDASGEVIIIGIDQTRLEQDVEHLAKLTELALENGAKRLVYSGSVTGRIMQQESLPEDWNMPDNVWIAIPKNNIMSDDIHSPILGQVTQHGQLVSENYYMSYWGGLETDRIWHQYKNLRILSAPVAASGVELDAGATYWVDYSIDIKSIPYYSEADFSLGRVDASLLADKIVLVDLRSGGNQPLHKISGKGYHPMVFVTALATETLLEGKTFFLGAWPALIFGWAAFAIVRSISSIRTQMFVTVAASAILLSVPVIFNALHVRINVADGLTVLIVGMCYVWIRDAFKRQAVKRLRHPLSNCRTTHVWRQGVNYSNQSLMVARVEHYAEIVSQLSQKDEIAFNREVIKRLDPLGTKELVHGEDGHFFWLSDIQTADTINDEIQGILRLFHSGLQVNEERLPVTISFGVDIRVEKSLDNRMAGSVAAAKSARDSGLDWSIHEVSNISQKLNHSSLAADLHRALEGGEIEVAFQPKVSLHTGEIIGVEALARWTHKEHGPVSPGEFIPAAERYGKIDELTFYILSRSLAEMNEMRQHGYEGSVAINLSAVIFRKEQNLARLLGIVNASGISPDKVIMEITETSTIDQTAAADMFLEGIVNAGIGLSIDDYGTGVSTLEQLKRVPAKELKIDKCFVEDLRDNPVTPIMVRSSVQLARALGMVTVIEGVEDLETLLRVKELGADYAQGYFISKPMFLPEFKEFLAIKRAWFSDLLASNLEQAAG